jgi:hypothetical protein
MTTVTGVPDDYVTRLPHELYNLLVVFAFCLLMYWAVRVSRAIRDLSDLRVSARNNNVTIRLLACVCML